MPFLTSAPKPPPIAEAVSLVDEYAMMTGQTRERIEADLDRDNYMTAVQAKAYGLVDEVVDRIGVKGADTEYS